MYIQNIGQTSVCATRRQQKPQQAKPAFKAMHIMELDRKHVKSFLNTINEFLPYANASHVSYENPKKVVYAMNFGQGAAQAELGFIQALDMKKKRTLKTMKHIALQTQLPLHHVLNFLERPRHPIGFGAKPSEETLFDELIRKASEAKKEKKIGFKHK